jgi:hypothetical protein
MNVRLLLSRRLPLFALIVLPASVSGQATDGAGQTIGERVEVPGGAYWRSRTTSINSRPTRTRLWSSIADPDP